MEKPKGLLQAIKYFSDFETCQRHLIAARWPDGKVRCPYCGAEKVVYLAKQRRWKCYGKHPRAQFSIKVGTIFEDSALGLDKWFVAIWMLAACKNGISSVELAGHLDIQQKSAWFMLQRIRLAMKQGSYERVNGSFEIDESFYGGDARFMHESVKKRKGIPAQGSTHKTPVMAIGRRNPDGKGLAEVRTWVVKDTMTVTLVPKIIHAVEFGSRIDTDMNRAYSPLSQVYDEFETDEIKAKFRDKMPQLLMSQNGRQSITDALTRLCQAGILEKVRAGTTLIPARYRILSRKGD